jgi:hypothetical protein
MTECDKTSGQNQAPQQLHFPFFPAHQLTVDFSGGKTSAESGTHPRRVIAKAEPLEKGENQRSGRAASPRIARIF